MVCYLVPFSPVKQAPFLFLLSIKNMAPVPKLFASSCLGALNMLQEYPSKFGHWKTVTRGTITLINEEIQARAIAQQVRLLPCR